MFFLYILPPPPHSVLKATLKNEKEKRPKRREKKTKEQKEHKFKSLFSIFQSVFLLDADDVDDEAAASTFAAASLTLALARPTFSFTRSM